jgi:N-acetylglutamate synthase-like GNAT family acetyltransferase
MTPPNIQARRATLDDLPGLRSLWQAEQLDPELEKRATEFQVAVDAEGLIIGALALEVEGLQGKLHSEAFRDFGQADALRPLLWGRIQTVAKNRGLVRLWTTDVVQFWRGVDFGTPTPELLEKLPAKFGRPDAPWTTLKLKDELLTNLSPEQEFKLFKEAVKAESDAALQQAKVLNRIALVVAIVFAVLVAVAAYYLLRYMNYKDRHGVPPQMPVKK